MDSMSSKEKREKHRYMTSGEVEVSFPENSTKAKVQLWGGGGAGGAGLTLTNKNKNGGGGGGAGGYTLIEVEGNPSHVLRLTIGHGGQGAAGNGTKGEASVIYRNDVPLGQAGGGPGGKRGPATG